MRKPLAKRSVIIAFVFFTVMKEKQNMEKIRIIKKPTVEMLSFVLIIRHTII